MKVTLTIQTEINIIQNPLEEFVAQVAVAIDNLTHAPVHIRGVGGGSVVSITAKKVDEAGEIE